MGMVLMAVPPPGVVSVAQLWTFRLLLDLIIMRHRDHSYAVAAVGLNHRRCDEKRAICIDVQTCFSQGQRGKLEGLPSVCDEMVDGASANSTGKT
jgi:hypothetical protein